MKKDISIIAIVKTKKSTATIWKPEDSLKENIEIEKLKHKLEEKSKDKTETIVRNT